MHNAVLEDEDDFEGWREAARALALAGIPADQINWQVGDGPADLFAGAELPPPIGPAFSVPRPFLKLAETVIRHSDPERFSLLYALLLRLKSFPRAGLSVCR